ncbi:Uncharacterised protein [Mycoplasmopsis citelli]|uniref:HNH nuclease domain-containing protein n=1 Tax=Mycoplasmopsis citelli TaxID=171281 RepID=A0A449B2M9_9BACT|nr:HNH endonuclease signature motif containing protein [Mycoplasmopsis citelli]VEU74848.1 Uncharacterised protein [Mycoplasmopsis citelli]
MFYKAHRIWEKYYGSEQVAVDFAGREIRKSSYGNIFSRYNWDLHHIFPKSKCGSNDEENLLCVHVLTNREAADKTSFWANDQAFEVVLSKRKTRMLGKKVYRIREKESWLD